MSDLYVVATPIGNLADISQRAIEVLTAVDVIAAEDTRHSGRLLAALGVNTALVACHDHNETAVAERLVARMAAGESVALISDAGTPLVSDPGYRLVQLARREGIRVIPIPGASAVLAALAASGLATDSFTFLGFLPRKGQDARLDEIAAETRTVILFESPQRILATVRKLHERLGDRQAAIARELTKLHEQIVSGSLAELAAGLESGEIVQRGEFVLMLAGAQGVGVDPRIHQLIRALLPSLPVKTIASVIAGTFGYHRRDIYTLAMSLRDEESGQ